MRKKMSVLAMTAVLAFAVSGCSSGPDDSPVPVSGDSANAAAGAQKEKQLGNSPRPPASKREEVLPWVEKAYSGTVWPTAYTITADAIYTRFMEPAKDVRFVEQDAIDMVNIWNVCAWTLQLIADTKGGKSVDQDLASLTKLAEGENKQFVDPIIKEAKLGGITKATQFTTANDCGKGFKG